MGEAANKLRILRLIDIFEKCTDEYNYISIGDIISKLKVSFGDDYGVDKRAVKRDIETLNEWGFEINERDGEHNKKLYSYIERDFELYELRMLIDAVSSARFITPKETRHLIDKIKTLTSREQAKRLQNQIHVDKRVKFENESVKYFIDCIHNAISENKIISFKYGSYDLNKSFSLHNEGKLHYVKPYGLVWNSDFYYLIGKKDNYEDFSHYRIDRMREVKNEEENFTPGSFDIDEYINKTFNMYSGEIDVVKIQFTSELFNVIIDKFGKDVTIYDKDEDSFVIRVHAAINTGLVRWILSWGSDAKVLEPSSLADRVKEESLKMLRMYE